MQNNSCHIGANRTEPLRCTAIFVRHGYTMRAAGTAEGFEEDRTADDLELVPAVLHRQVHHCLRIMA